MPRKQFSVEQIINHLGLGRTVKPFAELTSSVGAGGLGNAVTLSQGMISGIEFTDQERALSGRLEFRTDGDAGQFGFGYSDEQFIGFTLRKTLN